MSETIEYIIFDYESPLGNLRIETQDAAVQAVQFAPSITESGKQIRNEEEENDPVIQACLKLNLPVYDQLCKQLDEYFDGKRKIFTLEALFTGTEFQQEVWEALLRIPYGHSVTYSDVARAIGRPKAVRAVANAVGANPLCIIVPCHRVLAAGGRLGGYSAGLEYKRQLLKLEGIPWLE
ncbi:MAG: methylated-DNA--[Victivallales bacterium]|nr:methylated-DNA--[protein]-cysteine S-methyltransferase [Victivallales bacterium]